MAITFKNGTSRTRNYEELGLKLNKLDDFTQRYDFHLNGICTQIHIDFKSVKDDFDSGLIEDHVYHDALRQLANWFKNHPAPYREKLGAKEILAAIEKEKIVI